jgi:predicted transposase YdaD
MVLTSDMRAEDIAHETFCIRQEADVRIAKIKEEAEAKIKEAEAKIKEEAKRIGRIMIAQGMSIDQVMEIAQLSRQEVESLK